MKWTKLLQILFVWCLGLCMFSCQSPQTMLTSPDGQLSLEFTLDEEGTPIYCLKRAGKDVLLPSRLGLALKDAPSLVSGFAFYEKYGVH
jgi:hypothetical protein